MDQVQTLNNGAKARPTFSAAEMNRRLSALRRHIAADAIDAVLFTSYHNVNYYSDFLYCSFGRPYGLVVAQDGATSISANIDGGQPWRRTFGANLAYTDWQRDNYFRAVVREIARTFPHAELMDSWAARRGSSSGRTSRPCSRRAWWCRWSR